jgi:hypothetical protein
MLKGGGRKMLRGSGRTWAVHLRLDVEFVSVVDMRVMEALEDGGACRCAACDAVGADSASLSLREIRK